MEGRPEVPENVAPPMGGGALRLWQDVVKVNGALVMATLAMWSLWSAFGDIWLTAGVSLPPPLSG